MIRKVINITKYGILILALCISNLYIYGTKSLAVQPSYVRSEDIWTFQYGIMHLRDNGKLYSTGSVNNGQLGIGSTSAITNLQEVQFEDPFTGNVKKVSLNNDTGIIINDNGQVWYAGYQYNSRLGNTAKIPVEQVTRYRKYDLLDIDSLPMGFIVDGVANYYGTFLLNSDGDLYYTGNNASYVENNNNIVDGFKKLTVDSLNPEIKVSRIFAPMTLTTTIDYAMSIIIELTDGRYFAASRFSQGVGIGVNGYSNGFQEITNLTPGSIQDFKFYENMSYALTDAGTILGSGAESWDLAGDGANAFSTNTYQQITQWGSDNIQIYDGRVNAFAKKSDGFVYFVGNNNSTDVGKPEGDTNVIVKLVDTNDAWYSTNYNRTAPMSFQKIIGHYENTIAIDSDGYLRGSGRDGLGGISYIGYGTSAEDVTVPPVTEESTILTSDVDEYRLYKAVDVIKPTIVFNNLDIQGNNPESITFGPVEQGGATITLTYEIRDSNNNLIETEADLSLSSSEYTKPIILSNYTPGTYTVTAIRKSSTGEESLQTVDEFVVNPGPTINASDVTVEIGTDPNYTENVSAVDAFGVDITEIVVDSSAVNNAVIGSYDVIYTVTDSYGYTTNKTVSYTFQDTTPPVINAPADISFEVNTATDYSSVTAADNSGELITPQLQGNDADITTIGVYTITFEAVDSSGNISTKEVTVNIVRNNETWKEGYIIGYPDGQFRPDDFTKRSEIASIIYKTLYPEYTGNYNNIFNDISTSDWYYKYVLDLSELNVINGYPDGNYNPYNYITRAEVCSIIHKALYSDYVGSNNNIYTDIDQDKWYYKYVLDLSELGLVNGYDDDTFRPNNYITRAEIVTFMNNVLEIEVSPAVIPYEFDDYFTDVPVDSDHWAFYEIYAAYISRN